MDMPPPCCSQPTHIGNKENKENKDNKRINENVMDAKVEENVGCFGFALTKSLDW